MIDALFLRHKIERHIIMNGRKFVFSIINKDKYGQTVDKEEQIEISGLFHTSSYYVKSNDSDGSRKVSKQRPMILVLFEDGKNIEKDYKVKISDKTYVVISKDNLQSLDIAYDISLEEIQHD